MRIRQPALALKPRGDVTRNPKQGYQWPQNRTCVCVRQKYLKKKRKKETNAKFYTEKELNWTSDTINVLGIDIAQETEDVIRINYEKLLKKSAEVIDRWENRSLSLIGKVEIINTLIASLYVYRMTVLPSMPPSIVAKFNKLVENYIWKGRPKMPLQMLQNSKEHGGLQLVDIERKDKSIKATWVKMLMEEKYPEHRVYQYICPEIGPNIWCCNISPKDVPKIKISNAFWRDVMLAWAEYHHTEQCEEEQQILWWNSNIRVEDAPLWIPRCAKKGLIYVHQLFDDNGEYMCEQVVQQKYGMSVMQFNSIKAAMPKAYKSAVQKGIPVRDNKFARYMQEEKTAKYIYQQLEKSSEAHIQTICERWKKDTGSEVGVEQIRQALGQGKYITPIVKYQSFRYRLLHRILPTNIQLKHWRKRETDECSWCEMERETISHLLYKCPEVQKMWQAAEELCKEMTNSDVKLMNREVIDILSDEISENNAHKFICVATKQYIYRQRCLKSNLNVNQFKNIVHTCRKVEKYYAQKGGKLLKYLKRWNQNVNITDTEIIEEYINEMYSEK